MVGRGPQVTDSGKKSGTLDIMSVLLRSNNSSSGSNTQGLPGASLSFYKKRKLSLRRGVFLRPSVPLMVPKRPSFCTSSVTGQDEITFH